VAYRTPGNGRATHWTKAHRAWLRSIAFDDPVEQLLLENYIEMIDRREEALKSVDDALDVVATTEPYALPVRWLKALRGVDTLTAMILVAELFDIRRFESASELMAYLGLVPSERSSGGRRQAGGITRAGNGFVRRIMIEAAWHYQHKSRPASAVHKRREGLPPEVVELAERAESRLHRRYWRLTQRGKAPTVATTAVARELVGFAWALMKMASERATHEGRQREGAVAV
jgi:transposase